jgi:hypothetical protein
MRFTLTYDGELRANAGPGRKWEIRKALSPQLEELWKIDPSLQDLELRRHVQIDSTWMRWESHHSMDVNPPDPKV